MEIPEIYELRESEWRGLTREEWKERIESAAGEWQAWKHGAPVRPSPVPGRSWYDILEEIEVAYLYFSGRGEKEAHRDINKWVDKAIKAWEGKKCRRQDACTACARK